MKVPTKNTSGYAVCKLLYARHQMTTGEIVSELRDRFVRATIIDKLLEMEDIGQLVRVRDALLLAVPIRRHFEQCEIDARPPAPPTTTVATGPQPRPFKPLTGYKLSRDGMREGAGDFRNWPSRHLP